jgi:hypothetical protein
LQFWVVFAESVEGGGVDGAAWQGEWFGRGFGVALEFEEARKG